MSFSTNLKQLRIVNNMTQDDLAKKVGVCRQAISKWELGNSLPDIEHVIILANIFNITIDSLVDNDLNENINYEKQKLENNKLKNKLFICILGTIIIMYALYKSYQLLSLLNTSIL